LKIKEYAKKHIAAASEEINAAIKTLLIFILFSKRFSELAPVHQRTSPIFERIQKRRRSLHLSKRGSRLATD